MRKLALALAAFWLGGIANAGPFEDGLAAHDKGDYATAASIWQEVANRGEVNAQYHLGLLYHHGKGVSQDYAVATKWYSLAAQAGYPLAQNNMGLFYFNGFGVAKDLHQAAKWFRLAADSGLGIAQFTIAGMYAQAQGVAKDLVEAYKWSLLAEKSGHPRAPRLREVLEAMMTRPQIQEAERRAAAFRSSSKWK